MINTKIAILALSVVTAATTASTTESFREQKPSVRSTAAIPLQPVGDTVKATHAYSPALQCATLRPGMDINVISACAVRRVGWIKL